MKETCNRNHSNCNAFDNPAGFVVINVDNVGVSNYLQKVRCKDNAIPRGISKENEDNSVGAGCEKFGCFEYVLQLQRATLVSL